MKNPTIAQKSILLVCAVTLMQAFQFSANARQSGTVAPHQTTEQQVLVLLKKNPAVRGAYYEAKRWAGAKKCDQLKFEELTAHTFKAYASCDNPGDPAEEARVGVGLGATGQFHVSGTISDGSSPSAPVSISIDKIEFTNAG